MQRLTFVKTHTLGPSASTCNFLQSLVSGHRNPLQKGRRTDRVGAARVRDSRILTTCASLLRHA